MVKKATKKKVAKKLVNKVEPVEKADPYLVKDAGFYSRRRIARGWH